ncbi:BSP2p, variant 2 [Coprinopsis cinerea AmutBmut pab1-1]|nr:BSP2p, variant 2 [Coprinopsis cinerea AmutBmut pab1-1]
MRIEAAHIVASLAYGSDATLGALLRNDAPRALLFAISNFKPQDPITLRSAFARALKTICASLADIVGPPLYGIPPDEKSEILAEAKEALARIFSSDSLDAFLPLLPLAPLTSPPIHNAAISTSIAQLIATSVRTSEHRKAVVEWIPSDQRRKDKAEGDDDSAGASTSKSTPKKNRGWEKTAVTSGAASGPGVIVDPVVAATGGWAVRALVGLLSAKETKLQEAALEALGALARDTTVVAMTLVKQPHPDAPAPISLVHGLTKAKNVDVQLAACVCATRIIRACGMSATYYLTPVDDACIRNVISIVNRILGSQVEPVHIVIKTCFVLYFLITDDRKLSQLAYDRGCLEKLARILKDITPSEAKEGWDESEAESVSKLREAVLTALATLALFNTDVRRSISDTHELLPRISVSLTCKYTGVRYAACQAVRMLARAVSVLRTNIVDSGLGMAVFEVFKRGVGGPGGDKEKQVAGGDPPAKEDRRVVEAALKAICNIVVEFSPLRPIFLDQGVMPRLMQLIHAGDGRASDEYANSLRLNAMWAVKNLLWKSTTETKRDVMNQFGWRVLFDFLHDPSEEIQEQAYHIVRNIAENEEGISLVFRELCPLPASSSTTPGLTPSSMLDSIASLLLTPTSSQSVVAQATYVLANLANGQARETSAILHHPRLLEALRTVIAERGSEVRRPAVSCILQLVMEREGARERRRMMVNRGVGETLKRVCEWAPMSLSSAPGGSGGRRMSHGSGMGSPVVGGYLHLSDRTGGPGTSPTQTRSMNLGHQRTATGTFTVGSPSLVPASPTGVPTTPASSGAPPYHIHPHSYYHSHHHPNPHHAHAFTSAAGSGGISASVPSGGMAHMVGALGSGLSSATPPPVPGYGPYPGLSMGPGGMVYTPTMYSGPGPVAGRGYGSMGVPIVSPSLGSAVADVGAPPGTPIGVASGVTGGSGIGSIGPHAPLHPAIDVDKEVYDRARRALDWLEHGEGYGV